VPTLLNANGIKIGEKRLTWSGSGWRRSGGRRLVAAHERRPCSLFTVEPGLPQCWTCCRHGADEDKLARCRAVTVKGGDSQKEIQQPRGCTFSVSKIENKWKMTVWLV